MYYHLKTTKELVWEWVFKLLFIVAVSLMLTMQVLGQEADSENQYSNEFLFSYGDSCERLEELPTSVVMELIRSINQKSWNRFCKLSESDNCNEYSYIFSGLGFLTPTKNEASMCRFEPFREMKDWVPDHYKNYGNEYPFLNYQLRNLLESPRPLVLDSDYCVKIADFTTEFFEIPENTKSSWQSCSAIKVYG